ncbi:MAG: hypothetical protein ABWY82_16190 [Tardiphaga sp.]
MGHRRYRLYDNPDEGPQPQRPELTVWFDPSDADNDGQTITMGISAAWGTQQRFVVMTPQEAKALASLLVKTVKEAEGHELAQLVDPS